MQKLTETKHESISETTLLNAELIFETHSVSVLGPRTELAADRSLFSMA